MILVTLSGGTIATYGGTTNLTVTATGGTSPYTYKKNNGSFQASNIFTGVAAGTYNVTVKDANGCTSTSSIVITEPAAPAQLVAVATAGPILCNAGTTTVTVTGSGGTPAYSGTGIFTVSAGTYAYTVTDANGATAVTTITVAQPSAISVSIATGTITIFGGTTDLSANANGGTGSYTYKLDGGNYQASNNFTGVAAGSHSVMVKDVNGCTSTKNFSIAQPAAPEPLVAASSAGNISCNGGSTNVTVTASGGTAPYTGTGNFNVSAGIYNYTVTDANGLTATTSLAITQPAVITAEVSAAVISTEVVQRV